MDKFITLNKRRQVKDKLNIETKKPDWFGLTRIN